jgi:4'-phosphopantetheinyl transferase
MVIVRDVEWRRSLLGPELPTGEVHLWLANLDVEAEDTRLLSAQECERAAKFRFDHHRRRWTAARVLLRRVLGRYLATAPESVVLEEGEHGRRVVGWPHGSEWLSFSPSRSGDLALVAVARGQSVGVDVERVRADLDFVAIARRALGDEVADQLEAERAKDRISAFFRAWVREEARGKCRGTGLVELDDEARHVPLFVADLAVGDGYAGALATDGELGTVRGCSLKV